jgi:hypothetical protein
MVHALSGLRTVSWMVLLIVATIAIADEDTVAQPEPVEASQGRPIDCGLVILNGRYLPPPYVVGRRGEDLLINEHVIVAERFVGLGGPGMGAGHGPRKRRPWWDEGLATLITRVERRLRNDALLIVIDGESAGFVPADEAVMVLDSLLCDESNETKVQLLVEVGLQWITEEQWATIVKTFEPTPELIERVGPEVTEYRRVVQTNEASHRRLISTAIFHSRPVRYGITLATMGLAVVALGSLLSYHPNGQTRWREVDSAGEGVPMVIRNVVLLVLLGILDLVFTLGAQQGGGLLELNPLGSQLAASPFLLTSFKVTSLLGACCILVVLRRYRGAQVASWWLCLVCTVLAFRWLTYNSMFLS